MTPTAYPSNSSGLSPEAPQSFVYDGEVYRIRETEGEGSCGLHALLGEEIGGIYRFPGDKDTSSARVKEYFVEQLEIALDRCQRIQEIFCEVIVGYLNASDPSAEMLFNSSSEGQEIKQGWLDFSGEYDEKKAEIEERESNQWFEIIKESENSEFSELKNLEKRAILNKINEDPNRYIQLLDDKSKPKIINLRAEKQNLSETFEKEKESFALQSNIKKHYFCVIQKKDFFLNTNELKLAAKIFKLSALIVATRNGCTEEVERIFDPSVEGSSPVVIHHGGVHFSRCVRERDCPEFLSRKASSSEKVQDSADEDLPAASTAFFGMPDQEELSFDEKSLPLILDDRGTRSTQFYTGLVKCRGFDPERGEVEIEFLSEQDYINYHRRVAENLAAYGHYGLAARIQKESQSIPACSNLRKSIRSEGNSLGIKEKIDKQKSSYAECLSAMWEYLFPEENTFSLFFQNRRRAIKLNPQAFEPHFISLFYVPVFSKFIPEQAEIFINEAYERSPQLTFNVLVAAISTISRIDNQGVIAFYHKIFTRFPLDLMRYLIAKEEPFKETQEVSGCLDQEEKCREQFIGLLKKGIESVRNGKLDSARECFSKAQYYHISDKRPYMYMALIDLKNGDLVSALKLAESLKWVVDWFDLEASSRFISALGKACKNRDFKQMRLDSLESDVIVALVRLSCSPDNQERHQKYIESMQEYFKEARRPDDFIWAGLMLDIARKKLNEEEFLNLQLFFIFVIYQNLFSLHENLSEFKPFIQVKDGKTRVKSAILLTRLVAPKAELIIDRNTFEVSRESAASLLREVLWNGYDQLSSFFIQEIENVGEIFSEKLEMGVSLYEPFIKSLIARMDLEEDREKCFSFFKWANDHASLWPPKQKQAVTGLMIRWQLKTPVNTKHDQELIELKNRWLANEQMSISSGLHTAEKTWALIREKSYEKAQNEVSSFFDDWENQINQGIHISALQILCASRVLLAKQELLSSMPSVAKSKTHSQVIQCALSILAREGVPSFYVIPDRETTFQKLEELYRLYTGKRWEETDSDYFKRFRSIATVDTSDLKKVGKLIDPVHQTDGWIVPIIRIDEIKNIDRCFKNEVELQEKLRDKNKLINEEKPTYTKDPQFIQWVTERKTLITDYSKDEKAVWSEFERKFPKFSKHSKDEFKKELTEKVRHHRTFLHLEEKMKKQKTTNREERFWQLVEIAADFIDLVRSGTRLQVGRDLLLREEKDAHFVMELIYEWSRSQLRQTVDERFISSFHGPEIHIWGNGPRINHFNAGVFCDRGSELEDVHLYFKEASLKAGKTISAKDSNVNLAGKKKT